MANEDKKALLLAERDALMSELNLLHVKLSEVDRRIANCDATDEMDVPTEEEYGELAPIPALPK